MTAVMKTNELSILQLLCDHKADLNARDNAGETALMYMIERHWKGTQDRARFLLEHGARVSFKDKDGMTALDYARDNQEKDLIPLLEAAIKKEQAEQKTSATATK
jgi:ankyrin repeat protein